MSRKVEKDKKIKNIKISFEAHKLLQQAKVDTGENIMDIANDIIMIALKK
jgi:hypothetical protein